MLNYFKTRSPGLVSFAVLSRSLLRAARTRIGLKRKVDYTKKSKPGIGTLTCSSSDPAFNLFVSSVVEGKYQSIFEIGAFDGARSAALKNIFPKLDVVALDILVEYGTSFEKNGVTFKHYDRLFDESIPERTLIVCRGTLCCLEPDELNRLIKRGCDAQAGFAFYEPQPLFQPKTFMPRARSSYYHDYSSVFEDHSYSPIDNFYNRIKESVAPNMCEAWLRAHVRPPTDNAQVNG